MPLQEGVILQRTKVRVPSPFVLFLSHSAAGVVGAVGVSIVAEALRRTTRLSPLARAAVVGGASVVGGALVGRDSPRLGTGVLLGGVASAVPALLESVETTMAVRDASPSAPPLPAAGSPVETPSRDASQPPLLAPSGQLQRSHAGAFLLTPQGVVIPK
jgi:hypothetical protein